MLCIGTSGALGRSLTIPPPLAIWWRALFALILLFAYCRWKGYSFQIEGRKNRLLIAITGVLMTIHWVTYFYALQWSSVAIGMLSLFTYPAITTLLEPWFFKKRFQLVHGLLALLVLTGVYFLSPSLDFSDGKTKGLLIGLASALVYAVRNILLKTQVDRTQGSVLMVYQMLVMVVVLIPILFYYAPIPPGNQFPNLIVLALVTTAIGHSLFLGSFRHFSVSTASLISSIQPVYGILLGILFLGEQLNLRTWVGGTLIISAVVVEALRSRQNTT